MKISKLISCAFVATFTLTNAYAGQVSILNTNIAPGVCQVSIPTAKYDSINIPLPAIGSGNASMHQIPDRSYPTGSISLHCIDNAHTRLINCTNKTINVTAQGPVLSIAVSSGPAGSLHPYICTLTNKSEF